MISGSALKVRGRHPRRLAPLAALVLGLAALAVVLTTLSTPRRGDADPQNAVTSAVPMPVLIDTRHPGRQVHGRFLGLSFEAAALPQVASYADRGDLVALLRSLGPGILRFGGVSADTQVGWTDAATPKPAWATRVIDARDLRRLGRLAARSGWKVILTVGLVHFEPAAAAREVAAAKAALGPHLLAIEVGNEPDAYGQHGFRPLPWTFAQYSAEVSVYRGAIARRARGLRIAGPGVSGSKIFASWGPGEAQAQRPALLTGHHYPLGCHQVPAPSIPHLLSPETRSLEGLSLDRFMSVSRSTSIRFRMDELGSVSCGGTHGISDTFASTLWATGYLVQAMAKGVAGVNFQGNPANCMGYSPLCAGSPERLAAGILHPQPGWYAMLLARTLIGSRSLPTALLTRAQPDIMLRSFVWGSGRLRVVIVNDEPPGSAPAVLGLRVGPRYPRAGVLTLSAPSPEDGTNVRLGGRPVAPNGSFREPSSTARIPRRHGAIVVTVAPSTAALITMAPARGH